MEAISNHHPHFPLNTKGNREPAMEKLKEALLKFADSNPSLFPHDGYNFYPSLIEQRFSQIFHDFQTPDHPPYAAMIHMAIKELKEKRGSSEESISKYIKQEYADLPWAHSTLLKHHLEKLCDRKEISMTPKQRYLILDPDSDPIIKKPLKRKQSLISVKKISKKRKKNKQDAELGKRSRMHRKKNKKKEKRQLGFQETNQNQDLSLLDKVADEQGYLKINANNLIDVCIQEQNDINEKTQLEASNEANLKQNNEVNTIDIKDQEQNEGERSGHPEGKRVWTKSQIKMVKQVKNPQNQGKRNSTKSRISKMSKKEAIYLSQEKQEEKQASSAVSTKLNGKQTKSSSQKKKDDMETMESLDIPLKEFLDPMLIKLRRSSRKRKDRIPKD